MADEQTIGSLFRSKAIAADELNAAVDAYLEDPSTTQLQFGKDNVPCLPGAGGAEPYPTDAILMWSVASGRCGYVRSNAAVVRKRTSRNHSEPKLPPSRRTAALVKRLRRSA